MSSKLFGPIITSIQNFDDLCRVLDKTKSNTLKVVTAWGTNWTLLHRAFVSGMVENLVVRTAAGDPSYKRANPYPDVNDVVREILPWAGVKLRNLYVQIGNEPNLQGVDIEPYTYGYFLSKSCAELRSRMPRVKIITTPLQMNDTTEAWCAILKEQLLKDGNPFDYTGWHIYEPKSFDIPDRGDEHLVNRFNRLFFPDKEMFIAEIGIQSETTVGRERHYRQLIERNAAFIGGTWFHYNPVGGDEWDNYHLNI